MTTTTATVTVHADGTAVLDLADGQPRPLHADSLDQARKQSIALVIGHARSTGQAVTVLARDPDAEHLLEILPDGTIRPSPTRTPAPVRSAFAPPDPDPTPGPAPQKSAAGPESPTSDPAPPAAPTPVGPGQDPAQPRTEVVPPPPAPPAAPAVNTRRRVFPLAAVGAVGLGTASALWLWSHGSTAPTTTTGSTASTAPTAQTAPTATLDAGTLGVSGEARSKAPRPTPLPGTVTPVTWHRAATWQARRLARQRAAQEREQRFAPAWTPAPAPAAGTPAQEPARPAPARPAPARPAPPWPAPARPAPPSVRIYPDPVIQPDTGR